MTATNFQFPSYLGYAKAIIDSYHLDQLTGKETLTYEYKAQTTLEVEVTSQNAKITEYFNGKILGISSDVNLKQAFFNHYRDIDPLYFPIHEDWIKSVIDVRNVYADFITRSCIKQLYYPALFLIDIRVPILEEQLSVAETIASEENIKVFQPWIQQAQFVINYPDQVDIIKRPLLSFICPIAYSLELLNQIASAGLISKQKIFRPIVSLAQASSGSRMRSFFGRSDDEWERYAVTFQANVENFYNIK